MTAGRRDTPITVEQYAGEQEPVYGTTGGTWADLASMMAEVQDFLPSRSEQVADSINMARRPCRVRVDYFDGINITSDMRIRIDDRTLRIIGGPAEKGRKEGWEMVCEELSTEGDEP